jgi:Kef-type K+ transport system membrane component KefB
MPHLDIAHVLGVLALMLVAAKILGYLAQRIGQPAVIGELIAGVLLGVSVLHVVPVDSEVFLFLSEVGVVVLLFEIGLETNLAQLLRVGGASAAVAVVGVVLPFALGYAVCWILGLESIQAVVAGAALTATSVGITARVLADLGRLSEPESRIILGAAVIDDIIGLIILTVVGGISEGQSITLPSVTIITGKAFGFLIAVLLIGWLLVPPIFRLVERRKMSSAIPGSVFILALGLAWLADQSGSAMIIGAFAAGLLLARTPQVHAIQQGVGNLAQFFVPLFFVFVGAQVDLRLFNVLDPMHRKTLLVGGLLIIAAIAGKFAAGYAPFWFRGKKSVIGVGMIPRGEVGLIFAQVGLTTKVFDEGLFSAVTLMVMVTTFMAPPLLKVLFPPRDQKPGFSASATECSPGKANERTQF